MTHFPGPDLGGGAIGLDETDPELLALPAPPRGLRMATLSMMAVVVAAAVSLALSLRADLAYFFGQNEVTLLGSATALDPAQLVPNTYVQVEGSPMLSTAVRYPGFWGRLLLQSGSFAFTDIGRHKRGPAFDRVVEFVNAFRDAPGRPSEQVYLSCGMYESLIYENRSLVPLLQTTGMGVRYEWVRDGHNWENWRDRLQSGLSWLFPGPLWMVYE